MSNNPHNKYNFNRYNSDLLHNYTPNNALKNIVFKRNTHKKTRAAKNLLIFGIIILVLYWAFSGEHNYIENHKQDFLLPSNTKYTGVIQQKEEQNTQITIDRQEYKPSSQLISKKQNQEKTENNISKSITTDITVSKNDNIFNILQKYNIKLDIINALILDKKIKKYISNINPGEKITITYKKEEKNKDNNKSKYYDLTKLQYYYDKFNYLDIDIIIDNTNNTDIDITINSQHKKLELREQTSYAELSITSSLFEDAQKQSIPSSIIYQIIDIFTWDIDFAEDLRVNDKVEILYSNYYRDGELYTTGDVLAVNFHNNNKTYSAIRFVDKNNNINYYTPEGLSLKKAFIRSPVKFTRISSRFTLSRKHPVLHRIRAHRGVDYAAPTGTPIKAAGDGKITHYSRKGGYGKAVILQHGKKYSTLYAHMSKYNSKLKKGSYVKQGDTIGYVGQTGLASGPHLHFEFRVNNKHVNPLTVKLPSAEPIGYKNKKLFAENAQNLLNTIKLRKGFNIANLDKKFE